MISINKIVVIAVVACVLLCTVKADESGSPVKAATDSMKNAAGDAVNKAGDAVNKATEAAGSATNPIVRSLQSLYLGQSSIPEIGREIINGVKSAGSSIMSHIPIIGGGGQKVAGKESAENVKAAAGNDAQADQGGEERSEQADEEENDKEEGSEEKQ